MTTRTVLLVDDNDALRTVMTRILERAGYNVVAFQNAREVLSAWEAIGPRIQVVITDIAMPGMSGWGLISALFTMGAHLPILVVSSGVHTSVLRGTSHTLELLQKPFDNQELIARVDALIESHARA